MKTKILLFLVLAVIAMPVLAGRIVYTIDPSTAVPQPATVVANGQGEVVVLFDTASIESGMVFSFQLDMKTKGSNVKFPATAQMEIKGNKKTMSMAFDPAEFVFENGETPVSSVVSLTIPEGDYSDVKKIKVKIKAVAQGKAHLGSGPGVKVVLVKSSSTEEFLQAVTEELNELITEPEEAKEK